MQAAGIQKTRMDLHGTLSGGIDGRGNERGAGMSHDQLLTKLASAREKLFDYDRSFETLMVNGPEYVIDEMVAEIERLRKEAIYLKSTISNMGKHESYARRKALEMNATNILLDAENRKLRQALEEAKK